MASEALPVGRPPRPETGNRTPEVSVAGRRAFLAGILMGGTVPPEPDRQETGPEEPEELSALATEGNLEKLQLAERVAEKIENGAITPAYAEGTREALAGAGVLAVTSSAEEPQRTRRRDLIAGLLSGTILVSAADFARAQEIPFVKYNINSNERARGNQSVLDLEKRELLGGKISLEEFTRLPACESPRGARLFAQHEEIVRYNKKLILEKRARGEKIEGLQRSPIITFSNWYQRPSEVNGSEFKYSFFRLRDQVLVPDNNGGQQKVYKHYGVAQILESDTRQPHCLYWSGHLGTDYKKAEEVMQKAIKKY